MNEWRLEQTQGVKNTGVEAALDDRELRFLQDKYPDVAVADIQRTYRRVKRELMDGAKIRHLIPALALNQTNRELHRTGGVLEGQEESLDDSLLVGFEDSLDERDVNRLYDWHPNVDRAKILDMYEKNKAVLSEDAVIRDFIPVLALNLTNEELRGRRSSLASNGE